MKVLLTEIGSISSGDEAICIGAAKRFVALGAEVTFCQRVKMEESIRRAGIEATYSYMPIEEHFDGVGNPDELVRHFKRKMPDRFEEMQALLLQQDLVAIAPGGKFTEGLKNARALLTAAVAQSLDLPVIVLHQSVGPLLNADHRRLLREVFRRCRLVLIRDDRSMKFLKDLGLKGQNTIRCRDVAFGEGYPSPVEPPEYDLGINIRCGFNGHVKPDALERCIAGYKAYRPQSRILVYSTTWNIPTEVMEFLSSLPCDVTQAMPRYPDYVREVGRCATNVSDSWHGSIFSMLADRPVICCQTGLKTWKLEGIHAPDQEPLRILAGLVSIPEADIVLEHVAAAERNPAAVIAKQRRIVEYGRTLCEEGWRAVEEVVRSIQDKKRPMKRNADVEC